MTTRAGAMALLLLSGFAACGISDGRRADTYAVYSLVLRNPGGSRVGDNRLYLIQDTTEPYPGEVDPARCKVNPPFERVFQELLKDRARHRADRVRIEPLFTAGVRYRLVNDLEAQRVRRLLNNPQRDADGTWKEPVPGGTYVIRLTNVYFSRNRRFALVTLEVHCGSVCGQQIVFFCERTDEGVWRRMKSPEHPACPVIIS